MNTKDQIEVAEVYGRRDLNYWNSEARCLERKNWFELVTGKSGFTMLKVVGIPPAIANLAPELLSELQPWPTTYNIFASIDQRKFREQDPEHTTVVISIRPSEMQDVNSLLCEMRPGDIVLDYNHAGTLDVFEVRRTPTPKRQSGETRKQILHPTGKPMIPGSTVNTYREKIDVVNFLSEDSAHDKINVAGDISEIILALLRQRGQVQARSCGPSL